MHSARSYLLNELSSNRTVSAFRGLVRGNQISVRSLPLQKRLDQKARGGRQLATPLPQSLRLPDLVANVAMCGFAGDRDLNVRKIVKI